MSELEKLKRIRDELNEATSNARALIGDIDKRMVALNRLVDERFDNVNKEMDERIDREVNEYLKEVYDAIQVSLNKSKFQLGKTLTDIETRASKREHHILAEMEKTFDIVRKSLEYLLIANPTTREQTLEYIKKVIAGEVTRLNRLKEQASEITFLERIKLGD